MYISYVISSSLNEIQNRIPSFNYLPKKFYDTSLDFSKKTRRYYVKIDNIFLNPSNKNWIGMAWNREGLSNAEVMHNRRFLAGEENQTINTNIDTFEFRYSKISLSLALFSNSLDYLENYEEYFYVKVMMPSQSFNINFGDLGNHNIYCNNISLSGVEKLDIENMGNLCQTNVSFDLTFPVFVPKDLNRPAIQIININSNYWEDTITV